MTPKARIDGDGQVVATRLPRAARLADGSTALNYPALPPETLTAEGWRDLVDNAPPDHDPETHRAVRTGHVYDPDDDVVRTTWEIVERPPDPADDGHFDPQIGAPDA